tara:strand:+ start:669 stop:860 length:192 start_codon:yes stop_codon:yes gene_type:complete
MSEYSIGKQGDGTSYEPVIRQHEQTINNSLTIDGTNNAMSGGTITVASGVTVTISSGGNWVIV